MPMAEPTLASPTPTMGEPDSAEPPLWVSPTALWEAAAGDVGAGHSAVAVAEDDATAVTPPHGTPPTGTSGGGCGGVDSGLLGPWRLLLLGDGSPTRHLQLLTGLPVEVEVITMAADPQAQTEAPPEVEGLSPPLLRRQVWLRCGGVTLAWAESWWNLELAAQHLKQRDRPIWRSLTANRAELYREIDGLAIVSAPHLEAGFGQPGPYWSRHYRFFRGGKPLTVIREVFSPQLERWLGPSCRDGSLAMASAAAGLGNPTATVTPTTTTTTTAP
jgi:chorismate--pyruvate lyase